MNLKLNVQRYSIMIKLIKRIVLVVGFFPLSIYFFLRWVVTGKSALEGMDGFEKWANARDR